MNNVEPVDGEANTTSETSTASPTNPDNPTMGLSMVLLSTGCVDNYTDQAKVDECVRSLVSSWSWFVNDEPGRPPRATFKVGRKVFKFLMHRLVYELQRPRTDGPELWTTLGTRLPTPRSDPAKFVELWKAVKANQYLRLHNREPHDCRFENIDASVSERTSIVDDMVGPATRARRHRIADNSPVSLRQKAQVWTGSREVYESFEVDETRVHAPEDTSRYDIPLPRTAEENNAVVDDLMSILGDGSQGRHETVVENGDPEPSEQED